MAAWLALSLGSSLLVSLLVWFLAKHRWTGFFIGLAVSFCGLIWSVGIMSLPMAQQILLLALGTLLWPLTCLRPQVLRGIIVFAFLAPYAYATVEWWTEEQERAELRLRYPVTSVAERLAYEPAIVVANHRQADRQLVPHVAARLESRENESEWRSRRSRQRQLYMLHADNFGSFSRARNFGVSRMAEPVFQPSRITLPEVRSVPLPRVDGAVAVSSAAEPSTGARFPAASHGYNLHDSGVAQFVDQDRLGYAKGRDYVVGFEAHGFQSMPKIAESDSVERQWLVAKLELVSLLKHPEPRVYVSDQLPQMDQLKNVPTRALDAFEAGSLKSLQTDEDLVVDEKPNTVRMLGALRAGRSCLECHSVERGTLLGAFSYELRRVQPIAAEQPPRSDSET